jgi:hypothetical protein
MRCFAAALSPVVTTSDISRSQPLYIAVRIGIKLREHVADTVQRDLLRHERASKRKRRSAFGEILLVIPLGYH